MLNYLVQMKLQLMELKIQGVSPAYLSTFSKV